MHHKREVGHLKSVSHLMLPLVVKHALQKISETVTGVRAPSNLGKGVTFLSEKIIQCSNMRV